MNLIKALIERTSFAVLGSGIGLFLMLYFADKAGPKNFGELQYFITLVFNLTLTVNLRSEFLILKTQNLEAITFSLTALFFHLLLFSPLLIIFNDKSEIILFSILCNGIGLIIVNELLKNQNYSIVSFCEFLQKISLPAFALILFYLELEIMWALFLSLAVKATWIYRFSEIKTLKKFCTFQNYIVSFKKIYFWSLSNLLMCWGGFIPIFFINKKFSPEELGYYFIAVTIFGAPQSLLSKSLSDVLITKFHEKKQIMWQYHTKIFCFTILSLILGWFVLFQFLEMVLGNVFSDWMEAKDVLLIMFPAFALAFMSNSFDRLPQLSKFPYYSLVFNLFRIFFNSVVVIVALNYEFGFIETIMLMSATLCAIYLLDIIFINILLLRHDDYFI